MISKTCKAITSQREPCKAAPLRGSEYCLWHDPQHTEEVAEARRLGGLRRRRERTVAGAYDFEGLGTIGQIRRLVEVAAVDALGLENSISRIRAIAYLAQVASSLLERGELEARVEALEAALGPRLLKDQF